MRKLALIMMAGALTVLISMQAFAQPSAKIAVAGGGLTALNQARGASADTTDSSAGVKTADTGFVTVMRTSIKVPNDKGLAFDVALQSGINTYTQVRSKGGDKDTAQATGRISVRVKLTDEDGVVTYAAPGEGNVPENGVTYSYRLQELSATFQGLIEGCIDIEGHIIIGDGSCLEPEEVSLLLETLTANAFNFYYGPTDSGVYEIEVQAKAHATAELFDTQLGAAKGEAFVGLGSMLVETIRLIKGAGLDGTVELE